MDDSAYLDGKYLRKKLLPRLNDVIWKAKFAPKRFYVQKLFVVASLVSQEEAVINDLVKSLSLFSTTQEKLDWQPDDERRSAGDVYQHLIAMSTSSRVDSHGKHLCKEVTESSSHESISCSHSFRLSSLEICNAEKPQGHHIGATALQNLPAFEGYPEECENWRKLLFEYIVKMDDESPCIVWPAGRRRVATAVVWQVQLDIVDDRRSTLSRPSYKRRRYGPLLEIQPELDYCSPEKGVLQSKKSKVSAVGDCKSKYSGVRYRTDRGATGVWTAETRLPATEKRKNKVSFGDYKCDYKAARAIDAAFHYYGKGPYNFPDSPKLLETQFPSLGSLEGKEKLIAVKERAKWLAAYAPLPSTSPPSSPIPTACSLQEAMIASPGFSRSNSGGSDESAVDDGIEPDHMIDNNLLQPFEEAVDGTILDHMMDHNLFPEEPFQLNQVVVDDDDDDQYCEERTLSIFGDEMSCIYPFDEITSTQASATSATFMLSTALFPSQYDNCFNIMGDWGDASATHQSTCQASQLSQLSIVASSRL